MNTPIKQLIDAALSPVEKTEESEREYQATGMRYATHAGILKIGDVELKVYRLNTGEAIIDKESVEKFLDAALDIRRPG